MVSQFIFRLYGLPGCPHCEWAARQLIDAALPANSLHIVPYEGDPVITEGIKTLTRQPEVVFPVLVSLLTQEVIVGRRESDYARLVEFARTVVRPVSPDVSAAQGGDSTTSTGAPVETTPSIGVSTPVSGVPGNVVSPDGDSSSKPN